LIGSSDPCQAPELESEWRVFTVKNVSQENRCSPWNVFEEDVRYTVTTRCLSTLQFQIISLEDMYEDGSSLNALPLRTKQLSWTEVDNSNRRVLS
jgi:hypothetical protein